jgi:hypothetical protein
MMDLIVSSNILCIFSLVHNSFLVEANTLAWALGTGTGITIAGIASTRMRHPASGSPKENPDT